MKLSDEQKEIVRAAIDDKLTDPLVCPLTGDRSWQLQEHLAFTPAVQPNVIGGPVFPSVLLMCAECGYTISLNVFLLGVAEQLGLAEQQDIELSAQ